MAKFTGVDYEREYQVLNPVTLAGFKERFPFGKIGEEVLPVEITEWKSYEEHVATGGMRYLHFQRPVADDIVKGTVLTDSANGMWIPVRLLKKCLQ